MTKRTLPELIEVLTNVQLPMQMGIPMAAVTVPALVEAVEMLQAMATEIAELKEELATSEWLREQAETWTPDNEG